MKANQENFHSIAYVILCSDQKKIYPPYATSMKLQIIEHQKETLLTN